MLKTNLERSLLMKKSKLIIALVTPLLLAGCGSSKIGFKEDLKFERTLTSAEMSHVLGNMKDVLVEKGKKVVFAAEGFQIYGQDKMEMKGKLTYELFSDYYGYTQMDTEYTVKQGGVSQTKKGTVLSEIFDDSANKSLVMMKSTTGEPMDADKGFGIQPLQYGDEYAQEAHDQFAEIALSSSEVLYSLFGNIQEGFLVKGGTYAFVSSNIDVYREDINYGDGNTLRELKSVQREQYVTYVNKKFEVTKVTMYQDVVANYDYTTGEYFGKDKAMSEYSGEAKVTYGKKAAAGKKLSAAIETAHKSCLEGENLVLTVGTFTEETGIFSPSGTIDPMRIEKTRVDIDRYHVEATYYLSTPYNAFYLYNSVQRRDNYLSDAVLMENYLSLDGRVTKVSTDNISVMILDADETMEIVLSYDVVAVTGGVSFENMEQNVFAY